MLKTPLRVLNIEDDETDAELLRAHLAIRGFELDFVRVESESEFLRAVNDKFPDIVLADYSLPQFGAGRALEILRNAGTDIPFIVVSGTIGEERAIEMMRLGANDFVLKGDFGRLVPAIRRELSEAANRKARLNAEHALAESEESFKRLADSIPALVWIIDSTGELGFTNARWAKFTGISDNKLAPTAWREVFHPDDQASDPAYLNALLKEGHEFSFEHRMRAAGGEYRWFVTTATPVLDQAGRARRWYATSMDIQAQKLSERELDESVQNLTTLNSLGRVVSAELDLDKLVQSVTDAATKLCGAQFGALFYNVVNSAGEAYTLYTISGVPREAFSKFPMPRNTQVFAPTFAGTEIVRSDNILKDPRYGKNSPYHGMPSGHLPVVSYLAVPVISRSGEVIGGLFFGHSDEGVFTKRHEELLVGVAAQTAIAIDNARLYRQAHDAIQARDEFLSIASHELKTPLTSLKLQAQLHRRAISKGDPKAYDPSNVDAIVQQTEKQVGRLNRLVDDMLDVSRIRSGRLKMQPEPFDLGEAVRELVTRLKDQFAASSYELPKVELSGDATGTWDRMRVEQVVMNLLTNAIRYGNKKPIQVFVQASPEAVCLKVKDSGIGISDGAKERIFDRFERAINANEVSGLGLGLFITKQIVTAHGGKIWVESVLGEGSTFYVELPKQKIVANAENASDV